MCIYVYLFVAVWVALGHALIVGRGAVVPDRASVVEVVSLVCRNYEIAVEELVVPGKIRRLSHARGMAAWIVQDLPSYTLTELARMTGRDLSSLSAMVQRLYARSAHDSTLLSDKGMILEKMTRYS